MSYSVTIKDSSRQLSPKEKVMVKDVTNAVALDKCISDADSFVIEPDYYVTLSIHNDKAKGDKDYDILLIIDKAGCKFKTGSESFISAFVSIREDMAECNEEWSLSVYGLPSKNYSGKNFLTCSVI